MSQRKKLFSQNCFVLKDHFMCGCKNHFYILKDLIDVIAMIMYVLATPPECHIDKKSVVDKNMNFWRFRIVSFY